MNDGDERLQRLIAEVSLTELGEDEHTRERGLAQMREWIREHKRITNCRTDDSFLLRFLRVSKFDVAKATKRLENFYEFKHNHSTPLMCAIDINIPELNDVITKGLYFVSPHRDDLGRQVAIAIAGNIDPMLYSYEIPVKAMLLSNLTMLENEATQILGCVYICDVGNLSSAFVSRWPSLINLMRFMKDGEGAMPSRNKEVHLLNVPAVAMSIINTFKLMMPKKLQKRIMLHGSLEDLHSHVNSKVLPKEYGGEIPMDKMIESWKAEIIRHQHHVIGLDDMQWLTDKELKTDNNTTHEELAGTFKYLQID